MARPADPAALAARIERSLRAAGDPERAVHEKRYLRSPLRHFGTSVPAIRKVAVAVPRERPDLGRTALLDLVDRLWGTGVHECRMAAVELLRNHAAALRKEDLGGVVERLLRGAKTWALVDGLAAHVAGPLVERFPALGKTLDRWASDRDFWIRRASLLAELVALREGRGDFDRFARHAEGMLHEREFFVRKAIGWVLRDASRADPDRVASWLLPRASRASGLTLREATKRLPPRRRAAVLAAAGRRQGREVGDPPTRPAPLALTPRR